MNKFLINQVDLKSDIVLFCNLHVLHTCFASHTHWLLTVCILLIYLLFYIIGVCELLFFIYFALYDLTYENNKFPNILIFILAFVYQCKYFFLISRC